MFKTGFEKIASIDMHPAIAVGGLAAYFGGMGALSGHASHVHKKLIAARAGKDYKEKSFVDKHPKLTGALSLGIAPAVSAQHLQREFDSKNERVRKVKREHPHMSGEM